VGYAYLPKYGAIRLEFSLFDKLIERNQAEKLNFSPFLLVLGDVHIVHAFCFVSPEFVNVLYKPELPN